MEFKFEWKGKNYLVEKNNDAFTYVVLEDTREVLKIGGWSVNSPSVISELKREPHDFQESLAEELAQVYNAPIARLIQIEAREYE
jgi:hypothetical protein